LINVTRRPTWATLFLAVALVAVACGRVAAQVPVPATAPESLAQPTAALALPAPTAAEAPTAVPQTRDAAGGFSAAPTPSNAGFNGQSNLVPPGFPTPNTANERLVPGGPPRDPGPLDWARPGPYVAPSWTDFTISSYPKAQKVATTYYFYWHDLTDPERRGRFASGQFHAPPDPDHYSFLMPETHEREFRDMVDAGLDFVLPVYWGEPGHPGRTTAQTSPHYWSTEGIPPMVEAMDRLAADGITFKMGMFYDTTILANADLTTPAGREYFYVNVRDFYSRIPPKYWAAIDGRPIVWLYDTIWIPAFDQSSIDYLSDRFAQDFGGLRLFVVGENQWRRARVAPPQPLLQLDALYGWGAAANGFNSDPVFTVAQVGPGFTNTAYCTGGPERNCFNINREDGAFYERQLRQAIATPRKILAVETWNEFSEGTDIQETVQTGRKYIDLTRTYLDRWRAAR
jgi:hypothetical protein